MRKIKIILHASEEGFLADEEIVRDNRLIGRPIAKISDPNVKNRHYRL
jgi:hypothetical protein